jgi:SAM-dependent methyltransferase
MGNALEVGAGNGFFLIELRKMGYHHVIGVEPSVAACALAPDEIRSSLRNTTFTEQDFLPESFDLITCFQTLEHIPAPQHLIESFSKLLRRDGIVYAVSHDFSALGVKLLGHRHPIVNAGHLTLFDKQTLRKIFSKHFHVVSVFPIRNRYSLGYWVKLLPIPETVRKGMLSILDKTSLSSVPITMSLGNIGIIAKKR